MSAVDEVRSPVITVVRGRPTPAELAAAVAVLAAGSAAAAAAPAVPARPSAWATRSRARSALPPPGQRSWRAYALPR